MCNPNVKAANKNLNFWGDTRVSYALLLCTILNSDVMYNLHARRMCTDPANLNYNPSVFHKDLVEKVTKAKICQ